MIQTSLLGSDDTEYEAEGLFLQCTWAAPAHLTREIEPVDLEAADETANEATREDKAGGPQFPNRVVFKKAGRLCSVECDPEDTPRVHNGQSAGPCCLWPHQAAAGGDP